MKTIKFFFTALLLLICSTANAQNSETYLNVEISSGVYKSFPVTSDLKVSWGAKMETGGTATRAGGIDVPWVQLWENGPKFAKYNVGATSETGYGGLFTWGGSVSGMKDQNMGTINLAGQFDTATKFWGENWRMPTKDELNGILTKCTIEEISINGVKGCRITGTGAYKGNSMFLPAAGFGVLATYGGQLADLNVVAAYWSSTKDENNNNYAYRLRIDKKPGDTNYPKLAGYDRSYGYPVRAVLAEEPPTAGTAKNSVGQDVPWVQLWENGPKFAMYNIGVTDGKFESFGDYYTWGGSANKVKDQNTGNANLSDQTDTATKLWGENWRMPTKTELDGILANCTITKTTHNNVTVYKITGKNAYKDNYIFLPTAGFTNLGSEGNNLVYKDQIAAIWSSTKHESDGTLAYRLRVDELMGKPAVGGVKREYGFPIRAVLK